jgi:tetratricopeptide (TPR) repeat protein
MPDFFQNKRKVVLISSLVLLVGVSIGVNKYFNKKDEGNSVFTPNGAADENSNFYKPPIDAVDEAGRFIQQASENYFFREFDKGAENYHQAISIYEAQKDFHQVAKTYESLGDLYQFAHKVQDAESSYLQAVSYHSQNKDAIGEGRSLKEIGDLYMDLKRFELAGEWYRKAGVAIKDAKPHREKATVYESIGRYHWDQNNLDQAMENFLVAQEIFVVIKDQMGYDHITNVLALLKRKSKSSSSSSRLPSKL